MELAVIFDLDGTVINTDRLIIESFKHVFNKHKPGYDLSIEELHSFLGPSLKDSFSRYFSSGTVEQCIEDYRTYNHSNHGIHVTIYPGVEATLKSLKAKGYQMAIVTTKKKETAHLGLDLFDLGKYFDLVIGIDQVKTGKPDPEGINYVLGEFNLSNGIYVGDNDTDIMAAKNARVKSVGVKWSPKGYDHLAVLEPDYLIDSFDEIESIIERESSII